MYLDIICYSNHWSQRSMIIQISKSLKVDIVWEVHKRTQQGASSLLESYLYKVLMVHATNN